MSDIWRRLDAIEQVATPKLARAAVLVPLYEDDAGDIRVILTKRPDWMRTHPGDVVFPGGRIEPGESVVDTAIREAEEEIGLDGAAVSVLGGIGSMTTRDPRNVIVPVVARVQRPDLFSLEPSEVEAVIEPRIIDLLDDDGWRTTRWLGRVMWFYDFPEGVMWGATAFMMRRLLDVVRGGESGYEPAPEIDIRMMERDDLAHVRRTLYLVATWRPDGNAPPQSRALEHPYLVQFHEGWHRPGDFGVVALGGGVFLGGAYGRLFTEQRHAHGFVDSATPEIAVGVEAEHRGRQLGSRLLMALEDVARELGFRHLSLSVELDNAAVRLYQRLGYEELDRNDSAMRMRKTLSG